MRTARKLEPGKWSAKDCVVVGGGPSLKTFDWNLLVRHPRVIVVNRAWRDCPMAALWFSEDIRVIELWHEDSAWKAFQGTKIFHALDPAYADRAEKLDSSLWIIERKRRDKFWASTFDEGLSYSSNSMIGALNIASILQASPIYILGLDCNAIGKREVNYHDEYERAGFDRTGDHQYESFKSDFEHWAALHLKNVSVINLNPASAVECWPKRDWRAVLA